MTRTALVLDGDGAQSVVLVRAFGALGWRVLSEPGTRSSRSRWNTATIDLPDPLLDRDAFVRRLREVCERWQVTLVAPSNDVTLECCWAAADDEDAIVEARILAADRRAAQIFLDKATGIEAAQHHGFGVPQTVAAASAMELVDAAERIGFPCVIKPRRSFLRVGGVIRQLRHVAVGTRAEAHAAVRRLTSDDGLLPLAQEFVDGRSLSVTAVIHRGVVMAECAREALSFFPIAGGTSVWKRSVPSSTPGVPQALALLRACVVGGIAEVEYRLGTAGPKFMELGPRVHGWTPLAEAASPGFIAAAIHAALGEPVQPLPPYRSGVEMRWIGGELRRLRAAFRGDAVLPPGMSRLDVLKLMWPLWRPSMMYDAIDFSDPGPWLPRSLAYRSAPRNPPTALAAENEAPRTNRQNGPNVPSAG
jgi:predicted ATP-grasp superfamily ATP-dependent carboligase